jgi:hypothetical protein|tara:strand:- start:327 stop:743 length:417 start_codon:yes stop_codon:yes gene_type:complete
MRLYNIYGKLVNKNVVKYKVDWDKPCRSKIQFNVKSFFKDYWSGHICYEEFPVFGSRLKVDLINFTRKIAVEVQGEQHNEFNKFFHNNSRDKYLESIQRDMKKIQWLEMNEFKVLEVTKEDLPELSRKYIFDTFGVDI